MGMHPAGPEETVVDSEAVTGTRRFQGTYSAEPAQVGCARRALAQAFDGHPAADTVTLIASEFATNAVLFDV
jgi:hypothetical protein